MGTLTTQQMGRLMDEHFGAEARDDVEGAVASLTEDVIHDMVGNPTGPLHRRAAVRSFYARLFADVKGEDATQLSRHYGEDFAVDEVLWTGRAVGRPFGLDGRGRPISFRVLHVFEFRDGLISREQVWMDLAAIQTQLAGTAEETGAPVQAH
jgi:predicted ester cyclase